MKKSTAIFVAIVIVIAIGIGIGYYYLTKPAPFTHLRIGYQPSTHQFAHITAMEKGWWKENLAKFGIEEVTDYEFPSGPPEMTAMLAGELDIAYVGATPPITAIAEGLDAKIVAGAQIQGSALVLRPEVPYTGPEDLRGLKIATFPPGSIQDTVLKKWLIDYGIDLDELEIIAMGPGDAISAIAAEAVHGVFLPEPSPSIIELEGNGRRVVNSGEMWPEHACCCLVVSGKLIREQPEMVEEIIRIHIAATEYNKTHLDEAAELGARKLVWELDMIVHSFEEWDGYWTSDPHIGLATTLEFARTHYELGYTDRLLTEEDLFDTSFYDKIMGGE